MFSAHGRLTESQAGRMRQTDEHAAATSDEELMLAFARGDERCWEQLVGRYDQRIFNYLLRSTDDRATAEDLLQATFLRVVEARERYRPSARFSTWIYTIAANLARDEARRSARRSAARPVDCDTDASSRPGPEREAASLELRRRVAEAMRALPEDSREALILGKYEGRSYDEIAAILGCSVGAVTVRIHRAIGLLRKTLGVDDHEV